MIVLYRNSTDHRGDHIQAALEALVVAHRIENVSDVADIPLPVYELPAVVEGERVISGAAELDAYVEEMTLWLTEWRKFQSDTCYVVEDGSAC